MLYTRFIGWSSKWKKGPALHVDGGWDCYDGMHMALRVAPLIARKPHVHHRPFFPSQAIAYVTTVSLDRP